MTPLAPPLSVWIHMPVPDRSRLGLKDSMSSFRNATELRLQRPLPAQVRSVLCLELEWGSTHGPHGRPIYQDPLTAGCFGTLVQVVNLRTERFVTRKHRSVRVGMDGTTSQTPQSRDERVIRVTSLRPLLRSQDHSAFFWVLDTGSAV